MRKKIIIHDETNTNLLYFCGVFCIRDNYSAVKF